MDVSYASEADHDALCIFIDRFLDILELRCSNSANNSESRPLCLDSVTLHAPCEDMMPFTPSQNERIRALRQSGLKLYICRYAPNDPRMY
ncbi:hypothetical protein BDZ89DRAFT_259445 [Hymenopellis radicata]|nr:hypothetical protein BDZ89DRAFT_259445 [Hymenopellis radicata]